MIRRIPFVSIVFAIIVFATQMMWCAVNGKISGKVTDSHSGGPLVGANIILEKTSLGAAADMDGNYFIQNVPAGTYNIKASYIGYKTIVKEIQIKEGETLAKNLKLDPVGIVGQTVVVTAQASGQNSAINQQLSSDNIVNVVSAAKIQELPDANAAESVGRLPGVFLVRDYGEGSQVAIRGLEPKYNKVLIDGVEMPASDANNRATDLSMISSNMLSGIELYKTVTPDMDAAVLGGIVNFQIREARETNFNTPAINLSLQGGYDNLQSTYHDYKFSGSVEKRYFDDRLGIFALGVVERKNLTANIFGGSYDVQKYDYYNPVPVIMNSLNLQYKPTDKHRYDGTLVMDYKWAEGKVDLMNFFSRGTQSTQTFSQNYNINSNGNSITYGAADFNPTTNQITNILDFKQNFLSFNINARVSHAYTENINPGYWSLNFTQGSSGVSSVDQKQNPETIARNASTFANLYETYLSGISTNSSFTRQRNIAAALDINRDFSFSDLVSAKLKFGGYYRYTIRSYDYNTGGGNNLDNPAESAEKVRAAIIADNPYVKQWMEQHGLKTDGSDRLPFPMFFDLSNNFGKFLGGSYNMLGYPTNIDLLSQVQTEIIVSQLGTPAYVGNYYAPDEKGNIADDYSGNEYQNAAYIMATINVGPQITLIPGVRYQGLRTRYTAAYIPRWGTVNTYPDPFPHIDTTVSAYHGYWLPDVSLRYRPFTWLDVRLSYTNTLSYPDFNYIVPQIHINSSVQPGDVAQWNNSALKPARSKNYDLALSIYDNTIGLFTVNPFLKQIDDFIFTYGGFAITDPSIYPLPPSTKNYTLSNTQINNPNRVNLWGVELDWQTHFWYLPSVFNGLVMSVNYTHIFSQVKYPLHFSQTFGKFPKYYTVEVDTFYTSRLLDQPSDLVNLSVGYDYKGFSARVSMIFQADVFSGTTFWPQLRQSKSNYNRWDFSAKQVLPWYGIEAFFDINNINGEPDINVVQGTGFPSSEQSYGLTADLGLRWRLE